MVTDWTAEKLKYGLTGQLKQDITTTDLVWSILASLNKLMMMHFMIGVSCSTEKDL